MKTNKLLLTFVSVVLVLSLLMTGRGMTSVSAFVNTPPVADSQSVNTAENTPVDVTLTASDADGDTLYFYLDEDPLNGSLSGAAPSVTYTPAEAFFGEDSFTFMVFDGTDYSGTATVTITVGTTENHAPVAFDWYIEMKEDSSRSVTLEGEDQDGDYLTYSLTSSPAHGNLTGGGRIFTYTPVKDYVGLDSFTFLVNDGKLDSAEATVTFAITPVVDQTTVFFDNFESDLQWLRGSVPTTAAVTTGQWERANPEGTWFQGLKQRGTTTSGSNNLVTGAAAGIDANSNDVDGGVLKIHSPKITLPMDKSLTLTFDYYFAHDINSSWTDYLKIKIVGKTTVLVLKEQGSRVDDDAVWEEFSVNLDQFAGQTVYILIEVMDGDTDSLVEAAVDDMLIIAE